MAHDSYLINLASPDPVLRRRSIESFVAELQRCEALGLDILVSHPGNHMGDVDSGLHRNADAITEAFERVPGRCVLALESTSGSGTSLGATFEQLASILTRMKGHRRIGVCLDTCHMHSAGHDLATTARFAAGLRAYARAAGRTRIRLVHVNDSRDAVGSRRDRHARIGAGTIGVEPFRALMSSPVTRGLPLVVETAEEDHAADITTLKQLRAAGAAARRRVAAAD
jgi:deoxyribonuclease-4